MNVPGAMEGLIVLAIGATLVLPILALIDAARRPQAQWQAAGQRQAVWIILNAVAVVLCGLGWIIAAVYLLLIRPKLAAVDTQVGP